MGRGQQTVIMIASPKNMLSLTKSVVMNRAVQSVICKTSPISTQLRNAHTDIYANHPHLTDFDNVRRPQVLDPTVKSQDSAGERKTTYMMSTAVGLVAATYGGKQLVQACVEQFGLSAVERSMGQTEVEINE